MEQQIVAVITTMMDLVAKVVVEQTVQPQLPPPQKKINIIFLVLGHIYVYCKKKKKPGDSFSIFVRHFVFLSFTHFEVS